MSKKTLIGKIISDKMDKTVVVRVETKKTHKKYRKIYNSHKNYKADDKNNEFKIGEKVKIEETNPLSKDKKWRIIEKVAN